MKDIYEVGLLVGSLRRESLSRKVAGALTVVAPPRLAFRWIEIGELPHYNQDKEFDPAPSVVDFRAQVASVDALLFVTPEFNRSVPGVLKNALDIGSRPYGSSVWQGKPGAVVSVSSGSVGGFGANHHLRQSLVFLDVPVMPQPEAYVGHADQLFAGTGAHDLSAAGGSFLEGFMRAFARWIATCAQRPYVGELVPSGPDAA